MKIFNLNVLVVYVDHHDILALTKVKQELKLIRVKWPKLSTECICRFYGKRSLLFTKLMDLYLVSVDSKLLVSKDLAEWISVLEVKPGNIVWHACETPEGIIIQEYGESPTGLYASDNGRSWKRILTNIDIDPLSRHFHYISYDKHRDVCYATLGDSNIVRVVALRGNAWRPIYKGPWQFVPVLILEDRILFGFDSGIARGGIGIYYPELEEWNFMFLKWIGKGQVKHAQMNELRVACWQNLLCAALGAPQAILVAKRLNEWKLLYLEGLSPEFNVHMNIAIGETFAVCSTGRRLIILEENDFYSALRGETVMIRYKGFVDRLRGILFMLKRIGPIYSLLQHKLR